MSRSAGAESAVSALRGGFRTIVQRYLGDLVYGANDGIVTTLAVVSGVTGAALSTRVILILGFANLFADGFSMGASKYLSARSTARAENRPGPAEAAQHGGATFGAFVIAGSIPLIAYLLPWLGDDRFAWAVALALLALFVIGAGRALVTDRSWPRAGLEMLAIGALAGLAAYGVGAFLSSLTAE